MKDLLLIERPDIVAIADAVRAKTGQNGDMTLKQMANKIEGIQSGGGSACVVAAFSGPIGNIGTVVNTVGLTGFDMTITAEDVAV